MKKYDYREAVKADIKEWLEENRSMDELKDDLLATYEITTGNLYDDMYIEDSITGNASGSYTFDRWQAEENLCHNLDLLSEACSMYGTTPDLRSPEACDVTIRCYLLNVCLYEVLEEIITA